MALIKEETVDKIEILEDGTVQIRTVIKVLEDGKLLSKSYHRHSLQPGDDLSNEDIKVQAAAAAVWNL